MSQEASKLVMGIDTSCDETSVAILQNGDDLLSNVISSQIKIHQAFGGVVPELASRSHIENIQFVVDQALREASCSLKDLSAIAVTTSPGLIGCLLVGLSYAKSLAYSLNIPYTAVHHLKGHLFSPFLGKDLRYPFLGLVVSGGHTAYYDVKSFKDIEILGHTVDDAAGEAYDKVAKLVGLPYPGGPVIDKLARLGNPDRFKFTRARVKKGKEYLSFSGLKTAVSLLIRDYKELNQLDEISPESEFLKDLAASFQKEVVDCLIEKALYFMDLKKSSLLAVSGGVAMNSLLRSRLSEVDADVLIASPRLCMDNGGMIAYVGSKQVERGEFANFDLNAFASKPLW